MMEARELMYKNYISHKDKVWQVNDVFGSSGLITVLPDPSGESLGRMSLMFFKPIELTEKWLIEFGFEKNNRHYTKDMYDDKYMAVYYPTEEYKDKDEFEVQLYGELHSQITVDVFYVKSSAIKYIHQLQNLFWTLTQTELVHTIK